MKTCWNRKACMHPCGTHRLHWSPMWEVSEYEKKKWITGDAAVSRTCKTISGLYDSGHPDGNGGTFVCDFYSCFWRNGSSSDFRGRKHR